MQVFWVLNIQGRSTTASAADFDSEDGSSILSAPAKELLVHYFKVDYEPNLNYRSLD